MPRKKRIGMKEEIDYVSGSKGTFNLQGYVDVRIVAELAEFLIGAELVKRAKLADVMKEAVDLLHQSLLLNGKIRRRFTAAEAVSFMASTGFSVAQLSDERGAKNMKQRAQEALLSDFEVSPERNALLRSGRLMTPAEIERQLQGKSSMSVNEKRSPTSPVDEVYRNSFEEEPERIITGLPNVEDFNLADDGDN